MGLVAGFAAGGGRFALLRSAVGFFHTAFKVG
jgi:hypothetical protein